MTQASPTPFVALLSLISSNIAGYTKKTTVAAMYLIAYCVGNIIGTYMELGAMDFDDSKANRFLQDLKLLDRKMRHDIPPLRSPLSCAGELALLTWHSFTGIPNE